MRERDDLPARISPRKQRLFEQGELHRRWRSDDEERLGARVGRFLRRQAGRRWADVWPEADAFLRKGRENREIIDKVRTRMLDAVGRLWYVAHSGGANLRIVDGILVVEKPRPRRGDAAPTFSAAELMAHPELIEG